MFSFTLDTTMKDKLDVLTNRTNELLELHPKVFDEDFGEEDLKKFTLVLKDGPPRDRCVIPEPPDYVRIKTKFTTFKLVPLTFKNLQRAFLELIDDIEQDPCFGQIIYYDRCFKEGIQVDMNKMEGFAYINSEYMCFARERVNQVEITTVISCYNAAVEYEKKFHIVPTLWPLQRLLWIAKEKGN